MTDAEILEIILNKVDEELPFQWRKHWIATMIAEPSICYVDGDEWDLEDCLKTYEEYQELRAVTPGCKFWGSYERRLMANRGTE